MALGPRWNGTKLEKDAHGEDGCISERHRGKETHWVPSTQ